ncbi:hypothetical protein [Deinococcus sonorensis]|uniref:DUF4386 domain-containing protein n=1 Tax=Deinococcus sonorensis KR-87 TaxID=694439 RepID=A0AAU7UA11_9DEIO
MSQAALGQPEKLNWVTVPLIVLMVFQVLAVILVPLVWPLITAILSGDTTLASQDVQLARTVTGSAIAVAEVVQLIILVFTFLTYRAVVQGRSWGRIAAVVLFVLNILNFPFGTLLAVFGLIGAFDPDVQRYCSR